MYFSTEYDFFAEAVNQVEPVWSLRNMTYSIGHFETNSQNTTVELDLDALKADVIGRNETLYIHTRVSTKNPLHAEKLGHPRHSEILEIQPSLKQTTPAILQFESSLPLIAYHEKEKISEKVNLFDSDT